MFFLEHFQCKAYRFFILMLCGHSFWQLCYIGLAFFISVVRFCQVFNATQDSKIEKELGCGKVIDVPLGVPHENAHIIT